MVELLLGKLEEMKASQKKNEGRYKCQDRGQPNRTEGGYKCKSTVHPIVGCHGTVASPTVQSIVAEISVSMETCFTSHCLSTIAVCQNMSHYIRGNYSCKYKASLFHQYNHHFESMKPKCEPGILYVKNAHLKLIPGHGVQMPSRICIT
jgi:hypothetical protein